MSQSDVMLRYDVSSMVIGCAVVRGRRLVQSSGAGAVGGLSLPVTGCMWVEHMTLLQENRFGT